MQRRAASVYVLPGNHESAGMTGELSSKFGLLHFHEQSFEAGGFHIAGLGYSNPTPFNTPGEYSEREMARHLAAFAKLNPFKLTPVIQLDDGSDALTHVSGRWAACSSAFSFALRAGNSGSGPHR